VLWFDASGNVIVLPETVTGVVNVWFPLLEVRVKRTPDEPPTVFADIGSLKVRVTDRPSALTTPETTVGLVWCQCLNYLLTSAVVESDECISSC
jgi:hypothetical protein